MVSSLQGSNGPRRINSVTRRHIPEERVRYPHRCEKQNWRHVLRRSVISDVAVGVTGAILVRPLCLERSLKRIVGLNMLVKKYPRILVVKYEVSACCRFYFLCNVIQFLQF